VVASEEKRCDLTQVQCHACVTVQSRMLQGGKVGPFCRLIVETRQELGEAVGTDLASCCSSPVEPKSTVRFALALLLELQVEIGGRLREQRRSAMPDGKQNQDSPRRVAVQSKRRQIRCVLRARLNAINGQRLDLGSCEARQGMYGRAAEPRCWEQEMCLVVFASRRRSRQCVNGTWKAA
jgi:hypothetical protein